METAKVPVAEPAEAQEAPSATLPSGEQIYVIGSETAVQGTIKILEKSGFDRFRRLH